MDYRHREKIVSKENIQKIDERTWSEWVSWIATEDHCEWANRFVYWMKTPLGVLAIGAVASLACGLWVAPQGYAVLAAILTVIGVGLIWPWLGVRGLACELQFATQRARAGRPTGVDVTITNRWPWSVWGLAIEDGFFAESDQRDGAAVSLARIGGWSKSTFRWEFTPERRGIYPSCAPSIVTEFPFGLWKARRPVSIAGQLVAWPETFWLPPYPQKRGIHDWAGSPCDSQSGHEGERIGVRDHRPGDSLRMIHWAKSAALDRLVVSEREGASQATAIIEIDVDPASHAGSDGQSSLEWAIRIGASVCETLLAQGVAVEVQLSKAGDSLRAAPTRSDVSPAMDLLATFDTEDVLAATNRPTPSYGQRIIIRVGADKSPVLDGQRIVLISAAFESGRAVQTNKDSSSWIVIDSPQDVPGSVLEGWRSASQEAIRVS